MSVSYTRFGTSASVLATILIAGCAAMAQIPTGSSARAIRTDVERTDAWFLNSFPAPKSISAKAKLNLDDSKRDAR